MSFPTREELHAQVERNHRYLRPEFQETMDTMAALREDFAALGHKIVAACPISRELQLALAALDKCGMYAIASLARHEPLGETPNRTSHPNPDDVQLSGG